MEGTPEQQVEQLREEYERRVADIQRQAVETRPEAPSPEHQALSETTEGMIRQQAPDFQASSHAPGHSMDNLSYDAQAQIQEWVQMSLKDPYAGVKAAEATKDASLLDALHGALTADENYHQMVREGKIPEVN